VYSFNILKRGLALDCTHKQRRSRDSLDQNPPEAAKAGAVRHFARVRYCHFLLVSFLSRYPLLPPPSPPLPLLRMTWSLAPCRWYFRWRCCTLAHMRRAGRRYSGRSPNLSERLEGTEDDWHRDLSGRSWWLYHQKARVTREWTEPADRAHRLSTNWAPLTAGPTENEARLCHLHRSARYVSVTCRTHLS